MPLPSGETFAGFRIVRLLGSGGMGEVYLAQHPRLPKQIALKILPAATSPDVEFRERFGREADLAATLYHPHIVGVHDRGEYNGQLWIAMDFVDGADASRLLTDRYPAGMPVEQVLPIVTAVASALDYAHRRGMLHRDVKPANIMLTDDHEGEQRVLLADFGIARNLDDISGLTATNMTVGTVAYAAPEQLMGEAINGRADQYALGATAYHLLTGAQLFPHSNPAVVISRHLNASIPALADAQPGLATLDPVLAVALSKHQEDRFASCVDFARALSDHAAPSLAGATSQDLTRPAPSPRTQSAPADADAATAARELHRPAPSGPASSTAPTPETMAGAGLRRGRNPLVLPVLLVAIAVVLLGGGLALWHPWANRNDPVAEGGLAPDDAPATSPLTSSSAAPPPVPTTSTPPPPPPTTTTTTPPTTQTDGAEAQQDDWREHNTWVCDTATGEVCGDWTPEEVTFACKAVFSGADYTAGLKSILMSRYGMGDTDAFFLGKEAMYSVSSGGYINSGSMADGPHPLCNGIVP